MIAISIEVPIACFRQSRAREYAETYPVPPPSTLYGMLLSLVGETDRYRHLGTRLAVGMLSQPEKSTVIRTFRRFKKKELAEPSNARPDYQELLTDIRLAVWITADSQASRPTLPERLQLAFASPATVERFGGLCLGESRDLVNSVELLSPNGGTSLQWIVQDDDGLLTLPVWVDHVGSRGTRWRRYSVHDASDVWEPPGAAWTQIDAPAIL